MTEMNGCSSPKALSLFIAPKVIHRAGGDPVRHQRVLIFIVAYNAEKTIQQALRRIPDSLAAHETEVLIIDDSSGDDTFQRARDYGRARPLFRSSSSPIP
jgi:hypothetical protein